jgi:hypothetical protein
MATRTQADLDALLAAPTKVLLDKFVQDRSNATNTNCTGCELCTHCDTCSNCSECNNAIRCIDCNNADNCTDSLGLVHCNLCYNSRNCRGQIGNRSTKLYLCENCLECDRCICVKGGKGLKNRILGFQITAAQFDALWALVVA